MSKIEKLEISEIFKISLQFAELLKELFSEMKNVLMCGHQ